jgi:drug/metabolite transporter (DMT)-like permease
MTGVGDRSESRITEYALLGVLACFWASSYTFIKIGVATIPPFTLMGGRTLIAGAILFLVLRIRGGPWPKGWPIWRKIWTQATLGIVFPFSLIAWAEITVEASLASILNATTPIFALLFTLIVTRHESISGGKLFGVIIGMAGVVLMIGLEALGGLGRDVLAQLAVVAASACYAIGAIYGRNLREIDPLTTATAAALVSAAVLIPASLIFERPWTVTPSRESLVAMLVLAVVSTALAYVIYFRLIQTLGSVGTTAQSYLRVPMGVAIGVVFLGDALRWSDWAGMACIIAGVAAMTIPERRRLPVDPPPV